MPCTAYVGLPGSGKTYGVVENVISKALASGRTVYTNIPMHDEVCIERFGRSVNYFKTSEVMEDPDFLTESIPFGSLIIIDECWLVWPSGLKQTQIPTQHQTLFAEHRHMVGEDGYSTEIVLVTQFLDNIASFPRKFVENTYRSVKLNSTGLSKRYRIDVFEGAVTGSKPSLTHRISEIHGKYKKEVWSLYVSHTKSKSGAGNEQLTDSRGSLFSGVGVKIGLVVFFIALIAVIFGALEFRKSPMLGGVAESPGRKDSTPVNQATISRKHSNDVFKFLSVADKAVISFNNGKHPNIDYWFRVVVDGTESTLTLSDLRKLQYTVLPVNSCMVRVKGADFDGFILCSSQEKESTLVEQLVTHQT